LVNDAICSCSRDGLWRSVNVSAVLVAKSTYIFIDELKAVDDQHDYDQTEVNFAADPLLLLFGIRLIFPMEDLKRFITILDFMVKMYIVWCLGSLEFDGTRDILASRGRHGESFGEFGKKGSE